MSRCAIVLLLLLSACEPETACLRTEHQQVATYPYIGFASNPAFAGLAYFPVYVDQEICTKRAAK